MRTARVVNMVIMPARVSACAGMGANCGPRHAGQRGRSCARQRRGPAGHAPRRRQGAQGQPSRVSTAYARPRAPGAPVWGARAGACVAGQRAACGAAARRAAAFRRRLPKQLVMLERREQHRRWSAARPPGAAQLRRQRQRLRKGAEGMRGAGRAARAPPVRADQLLEGRSVFRRALLSYLVPPPLFGRSSCLRARARAKRRQKSVNPRCRRGDGCGCT